MRLTLSAGWSRHGDAPSIPDTTPSRADRIAMERTSRRAVLGRSSVDLDEHEWVRAVESVQELIRAGEVYVLNLTMRLTGKPRLSPVEAFAKLHLTPGAPMAAFFGSPDDSVVSVSPERFLGVTLGYDGIRRRAEVWPIKGTAARGSDADQDARIAAALAANEKERAEHVMIVDLERNDLGRVCEAGSIVADPFLEVFQTPYCHQMVSCVSGEMLPATGFDRLLDSTFPCAASPPTPTRWPSGTRHGSKHHLFWTDAEERRGGFLRSLASPLCGCRGSLRNPPRRYSASAEIRCAWSWG